MIGYTESGKKDPLVAHGTRMVPPMLLKRPKGSLLTREPFFFASLRMDPLPRGCFFASFAKQKAPAKAFAFAGAPSFSF